VLTGKDEIFIDLVRDQPQIVLLCQVDERAYGLLRKTAPVGFDGLLMTIALVRGVICASRSVISGK
jgi:hypothetical protein